MSFVVHEVSSTKKNYLLFVIFPIHLILSRIGFLGTAHGWGGGEDKKAASLKSATHISE